MLTGEGPAGGVAVSYPPAGFYFELRRPFTRTFFLGDQLSCQQPHKRNRKLP